MNVYEASSALGGQVRQGAIARGRDDFAEPVRFLARSMDRLGIDVHLSTTVDVDFIDRLDVDAIIVATGAHATASPIPGSNQPHVESAITFLSRVPGRPLLAPGTAAVIPARSWGSPATPLMFLAVQGYSVKVVGIRVNHGLRHGHPTGDGAA